MINFKVFNYQTNKIVILKNDPSQNINRISPKKIEWNINDNYFSIEPSKPGNAILIGKDYILLQQRVNTFDDRCLLIYDFKGEIQFKVKPPNLKSKELNPNNGDYIGCFDGFHRLERKISESPYEIILNQQRHALVSLYDNNNGSDSFELDDKAGKIHELQALNIEKGEFDTYWVKNYGRF